MVLALTFSIVEALLILPSHLRHLHADEGEPARAQRIFSNSMDMFEEKLYAPLLDFVLRHKLNTLIVFCRGFIALKSGIG